jgi:muconate cycloisomerase
VTKIDRIETTVLDIPTIRGHVLSMTTMTSQAIVLVRIQFSDGSEGIGEGTSIGGLSYGPESAESIKSAIDTYIAPLLLGLPADGINASLAAMQSAVKGNPIARCAVETALWDGLARRLGVPVSQLFGGAVRASMPVAWTLASGNSEKDISEAQEMLDRRRHRIFKLKIGKRPVAEDIAHGRAAPGACRGPRGGASAARCPDRRSRRGRSSASARVAGEPRGSGDRCGSGRAWGSPAVGGD